MAKRVRQTDAGMALAHSGLTGPVALPKGVRHAGASWRARLRSGALALALALALSSAGPLSSFADVRKDDVVYGQSVESRGLAVAQCPNVDADYALVMDAEGTVYFERSADHPTQIASITKIMTALVALDEVSKGTVSLDTPVKVSKAAADVGESSAGLQAGDGMDLETALKALLVPSGNDAAVAIAETIGAKMAEGGDPVAAFVAAMNAKASELGCSDTLYENPHGLDFDQYAGKLHSTAADVSKVVQDAMRNQTFRTIVGGGSTDVTVTRGGAPTSIHLETTDGFFEIYDYAIGVKTGFTELAGPSFAGAASKDGRELYAIVIHSSSEAQRFEDAKNLCDWVYQHEVSYRLANSPQTATMNGEEVPLVAEVAHAGWIDKTVKATLRDPQAAVDVFDLNGNVSQSLEFDKLEGTVHVGDKVGTITFKQRNSIIATMDLVACEGVDPPGFFDGIGIWWDRLFRSFTGAPQLAQSLTLNETPLVIDKTAPAA